MTPTERSRAYWNDRPCNSGHSVAPVHSLTYHLEVSDKKYRVEPHLVFFACFPAWRGLRVLDVGCGIGTVALSFADHGAHVVAVDFSDTSLMIARQRKVAWQEAVGYDLTVDFYRCNVENLRDWFVYWRAETAPFDLLWCWGVLHHLEDPRAALLGMRRVAGSGSVLRVMVYYRWSLKALAIRLGLAQPEAAAGCPLFRWYSRREIRRLLETAGFRVTKMEVAHIFPYRWREYRQGGYVKLLWVRLMPRRCFRLLERLVGWHLMVEARPCEWERPL